MKTVKKTNPTTPVNPGDRIDAYNDGKPSPSRLSAVVVEDVVKRKELPIKYLKMWKKAINDDFNESLIGGYMHYMEEPQQFWDWNCDTFIFAHFPLDKESAKDPIMFAKRPNGWYGVNWNYQLDISGKIRRQNLKTWKQCAAERGTILKWNAFEGRFEYLHNSKPQKNLGKQTKNTK